jgi:multimeric flavodoxin WrbA
MKTLLIVFHTQSGASARLAQALYQGACEEADVVVRVRRAWDCGTTDLEQADAVALVAAENAGALSGGMKDFLDRTFYPAIDRGLVMPYILVISAGNDGRNARRQVQRMLAGIPLVEATEGLICRGPVSRQHLADCRELGQAYAAGLAMGIF